VLIDRYTICAMSVYHLDRMDTIHVTPQHSDARGELITGETIEVGRIRFAKGESARPHQHPQEQIVYVISGRCIYTAGDVEHELGPGDAIHLPSNLPHHARALEDFEAISCKSVIEGVGHKL
jgi:unsaturated pyranuronate lyase